MSRKYEHAKVLEEEIFKIKELEKAIVKSTINNKEAEIERLKMENALLRDFLYPAGKG